MKVAYFRRHSFGDVVFDALNYIIITLLCLSMLYPFMYTLSLSLTSVEGASQLRVGFIPKEFNFSNYARVIESIEIWRGFKNTILRLALGVPLQLVAVLFTAYPLSKRYFPHRSKWTMFIVFTMFFSGGLIPTYLLVNNTLHMQNQVWALILPGLIPTYSMIIMRNFFMALPESIEESARIDGAEDFTILFRLIVPVSMPIIATITLWQMVYHWNAWFDCMIYISDMKKHVLQLVLRRIVMEGTEDLMSNNNVMEDYIPSNPESVKAASIMVTTIPIIITYPFLQKYFVKGIMVGSLKG